MQVKQEILKHVTRDGACGFGVKEATQANSIQDLIDLLLTPKGIEHCMEYQFPSMSILQQHKDELKANNIYVDGEHSIENPRLIIAFGGVINIKVDGYNVSEIYATNDAKINISSLDHAFVSIQLNHNAICNKVKVAEFAKINIYG